MLDLLNNNVLRPQACDQSRRHRIEDCRSDVNAQPHLPRRPVPTIAHHTGRPEGYHGNGTRPHSTRLSNVKSTATHTVTADSHTRSGSFYREQVCSSIQRLEIK